MSTELQFTLPNGLRVFVQESHAAPVVALQMWVGVGSLDERPEEFGVAHQLEHMMFKGTARRGVGVVAQEVEGAGGEINAFTSFDQTVYHLTMAARHFDQGLDILADVIQHSRIDAHELSMEKEVVLEEVRRFLDNPSRQLDQAMFRTVFQQHPYGRPVIGYVETVKAFERSHVEGFYARWYTPDNMVLVIVGAVQAEEVREKVSQAFDGFVRPAVGQRTRPVEPPQEAPRYVSMSQAVQEAHLELAFPAPSSDHPDTPYLDLLALILGQGESSRLVEKVKNQQQLVNSIHAFAYTPRDPGMFLIGCSLEPSRLSAGYEAVLEELRELKQQPVRSSELRKAQSIIRSNRVYERETVEGRARKFGYYLLTWGSLEREKAYYRAVEEATPDDLYRVARAWLDPEKLTVGVMLPRGMDLPEGQALLEQGRERLKAVPALAKVGSVREQETVRLVLPNGIRVLVRQNHSVPLVAVRAVLEGGLRFERAANNGVFNLIGQLLTRGTPQRNAFQIAHEVDSLAGSLDGFAGRNALGLRAEFLSQHLERGMELLCELLRQPSFDALELDRARRLTLEAIRTQEDHPSSYAFRQFCEGLYLKHPFKRSLLGTDASVREQTPDSLRQTYRRYLTGGNLVLAVVGDVDPRDIEAMVAQQLGGIPAGLPPFPRVPLEPPLKRRRVLLKPSDKQQLHLVIGWRGVSVDHPDRYPLGMLSSILSGQGGRLFLELRDRQALAYSVSSLSMEAVGEGFFAVYIGTEPRKFGRARDGILGEVKRLLDHGVTEEEMARARRYMVGSYEIELQRSSSLCANLAFNEAYGLGHDSFREYPARVAAVTRDQVNEVARKYLDPEVYVLSGVGPVIQEA